MDRRNQIEKEKERFYSELIERANSKKSLFTEQV